MPHKYAATASTAALGAVFVAAAGTSNWAINNIGRDHGPHAPHTIPIGWGLQAPSGVLLIGLMFAVRDSLHERVGIKGTLLLIAAASAVSAVVAPPALAVASGLTMLVAEATDALVYQQLRTRGRLTAATVSNLASSLLDSALFLIVAFGAATAIDRTLALFIGKFEASLATLVVLSLSARLVRHQREHLASGTDP